MELGSSEFGLAKPISVSVLHTLTEVLRANSNRHKLILINDSDTVIYVHYGNLGAVNSGIRLNANGFGIIDEPDSLGAMWKGQIYAIAAAAGGKILCGYEL